jgi:hypothetical protein
LRFRAEVAKLGSRQAFLARGKRSPHKLLSFLLHRKTPPMLQNLTFAVIFTFASFTALASEPAQPAAVEYITALTGDHQGIPVKLKKNGSITTKASFSPPVEITIEAKTDSTNLRLGYAADQLIFNWERDRNQLRVDGGPAAGKHKFGAGNIPVNKYVTIRWLVTPTAQSVYVNDELRFEDTGNYSGINRPISVFSAAGSEVTVKSIKVKDLPPATP